MIKHLYKKHHSKNSELRLNFFFSLLPHSALATLVGAIFLVALGSNAGATLTDSLTIGSAKAVSLGHAVTADPPGIDSVHFNPAGLIKLKGRQRHIKLLSADFSIELGFGDYGDKRDGQLDVWRDRPLEESFFEDEAHNTSSQTEGATAMIPVAGMVDLPVALAPLAGFSYAPEGSDYVFATNFYTPLFLGFNRAEDDPGRYMGEQFSLSLITYFAPSLAFRISDSLTVGVSINFNYAGVGLNLPFRSPHEGLVMLAEQQSISCTGEDGTQTTIDALDLCGGRLGLYDLIGTLEFEVENTMTPGLNFGFLWEPTEWLTLGLAYNSSIKMDLKGDFTWVNEDGWVGLINGLRQQDVPLYDVGGAVASIAGYGLPTGEKVHRGTASIDMKLPEHWAVGMSMRVTPRTKINFDVKWTGWSSFASIPVQFSTAIDLMFLSEMLQPSLSTRDSLTFPLGLQDTWNWGIGVEYTYSDRMVLRAGLEDRPSATPPEAISPLVPLGAGKFYGLGFGYQMPKGSVIDVALGYFSSDISMDAEESDFGNTTNPYKVIYNPYAGTDIDASVDAYLVELSYSSSF